MQRVLEPELMNDADQVTAYAKADFSTSNQAFVDQLLADYPNRLHNVIDLGCGPADVMIRLAQAQPNIHITAVDGASEMIAWAQTAVAAAGLAQQITLIEAYIPGLDLPEHSFDACLSKDFLHHLPDPQVLWAEMKRLSQPGAIIYVMDLIRPPTSEAAHHIVETVAGDEHPILKLDFYNSLCAAFEVDEIREQLARAGLTLDVAPVSERHMLIKGVLA